MRQKSFFLIFFAISAFAAALFAGDPESYTEFDKGKEKEKEKSYVSAAKIFLEAEVEANDPVLKANALMNAARCYRKAGQYCAEFDCLQRLAKGHIGRIDYDAVVRRQYEIAEASASGHRDFFVEWLPFLKKDDRTAEFFKTVLENAPCFDGAPSIRLRLGRIYMDDQKPDLASAEFMQTMKLYPDTPEARYAALELANVYYQLAERGDGDGKNAREALEAFESFLEKHPDDPETQWVRNSRDKVYSFIAARYCHLGEFYRKKGNLESAQRYFAIVLRDYPNTPESKTAEKNLMELDKDFLKSSAEWTPAERKFKQDALPREDRPVMIVPTDSDGRWLMPIRDVRQSMPKEPLNQEEEIPDDAL